MDGSIPEFEWREANYIQAWENLGYEWTSLEEYLRNCYQDDFCNSFHHTQPYEYIELLAEAIREGVVLMSMNFGKEFEANYKKLEALGED